MTNVSEKRMLTAPNSKLTSVDLSNILGQDAAWATLDIETRQRLYSLLPAPKDGEAHNPHVNPLETAFGKAIEDELRKWQEDLKEGRESKKWREDAMQAGRDRASARAVQTENEDGNGDGEGGENGEET